MKMSNGRALKGAKAKKVVSLLMVAAVCGASLAACGPNPSDNDGKDYLVESTVSPSTETVSTLGGKHYAEYTTKEDMWLAAKDLAIEIASEGDVLLKNANHALPLKSNERKVSLFGARTVNLITSGGGSGGGGSSDSGFPASTLPDTMEEHGFSVNKKLIDAYNTYKASGATAEAPMTTYTSAAKGTYSAYNDAAIVTLSRGGHESADLAMYEVNGHSNAEDHELMLDDHEKELIKHVKHYFGKVIVLINSSNIMQVPELAADKTADNYGVDAILWIGNPGAHGIEAVPKLLTGEITPSGKTVDLWARDFTEAPTYTNFSQGGQNKDASGTRLDANVYFNGTDTGYRSVEYREGIYMGYRYYETVAADMNAGKAGSGDEWYDEQVLYPFGYGLSYTQFKWELENVAPNAKIGAANETVTLKVKVTNTGNIAGKDVVQAYYSAPYTKGGIEKAATNLVQFEKTDLLAPGESQVLTLAFTAQDMASFDYADANKNGFYGYELESGEYTVTLNKNSHEPVLSVKRTVDETILCKTDIQTGKEIKPLFTGEYTTVNNALESKKISRSSGLSQPVASSKEDRTVSQSIKELLDSQKEYHSYQDQTDDPWYVEQVPSGWDQAATNAGTAAIQITEMTGVDYTDLTIKDGRVTVGTDAASQKWEKFMNQLTWQQMVDFVEGQGGGGALALPQVGVVDTRYGDGPVQFSGGTNWTSAPITAATYNKELAEKQGRMIGNEGLLRDKYYWAGPGLNTHRSPLSGRNFEYYSEDGVQGGLIASSVIKGATDMGVVCFMKHMFLNDQEAYRDKDGGVLTFADEQVMREIYLKPFEMSLKRGGCVGIMSSFNRLGYINSALNNVLHEDLVRVEWNSKAIWVTDAWQGAYCPVDLMVRAGDTQALNSSQGNKFASLEKGTWDAGKKCVMVNGDKEGNTQVASPTHYVAIRKACQEMLYIYANSGPIRNGYSANLSTKIDLDIYASQSMTVAIDGIEDFTDLQLADGEELPVGFELVDGVLSGVAKSFDPFSFKVKALADGYIPISATVNVNIQNPIHDTGSDLTALKVGTAMETVLRSEYYAYGGTCKIATEVCGIKGTIGGGPWGGTVTEVDYWEGFILNWYKMKDGEIPDGSFASRRDDGAIVYGDTWATDAMYITEDQIKDAKEKHIYQYKIVGDLPAGLQVEYLTRKHSCRQGGWYDVADGIKITGTPTKAGDYTIKVQLELPLVYGLGTSWPNFAGTKAPKTCVVERELTIHVA